LIEKKTKKKNRIYVTDTVKKVLVEYVKEYPEIISKEENYLLFTGDGKQSFGRRQALNIMH
jgi:hypothetical protein